MAGFIKHWLVIAALLLCMACSGCTTTALIVAGLWVADEAIEIASGVGSGIIDAGGGLIEGTGKLLTDKQTRFDRAASVDSKNGTITLAKSEFSPKRVSKMIDQLEFIFAENGWSYTLMKKDRPTKGTDILESWECEEVYGAKFDLTFKTPKNKDTQITIKTVGLDDTIKDEITAQIFNWIKQAAMAT
ncbi:MAG: hypothetical protein FVQ82_09530 [Planctomycetes bacterium]|nr:hypothetical protein [Planctomycetota bacterium]